MTPMSLTKACEHFPLPHRSRRNGTSAVNSQQNYQSGGQGWVGLYASAVRVLVLYFNRRNRCMRLSIGKYRQFRVHVNPLRAVHIFVTYASDSAIPPMWFTATMHLPRRFPETINTRKSGRLVVSSCQFLLSRLSCVSALSEGL